MAIYAKIDKNNFIIDVIVFENEDETKAAAELKKMFGGTWKKSSKSGEFRKNPAGIGAKWNPEHDGFEKKKPYDSWILDTVSLAYFPPVSKPADAWTEENQDGIRYSWNEETQSWEPLD